MFFYADINIFLLSCVPAYVNVSAYTGNKQRLLSPVLT